MVIASSISGLPIYAPSAAFAPTNSAEVSAIASAYQVVSATATQLYAGTAYVTSVNDAPLSASRAGKAANASLANSAWYDGTGRLISALPDSAAVSAIASSYAESAASSKLDSSASSSFYPADNPSGFISSVDLSDYATTAYVDSSISGFAYESAVSAWTAKQDQLTFGYNTANQISSINGSALGGMDEAAVSGIASAYAESAVSSKADSSALSSYALSADVSGTVDLVSTQSANWGGSALALSAGPGVKLEKVGNTLVASTDETVLWSNTEGKLTKDLTFPLALNETITNFKRVKFLYGGDSYVQNAHWIEFDATDNNPYTLYDFRCDGPSTTDIFWRLAKFNISGTAVTNTYNSTINLNTAFAGNGYNTSGYNYLVQIVGINRTAEA